MTVEGWVAPLVALQFVAFGWRINREIPLGDQGRRTWFPIPDYVNIGALLIVVGMCIVLPIGTGSFGPFSRTALAAGYTLAGLHPLNVAAHYRLFSREGRYKYTKAKRDYPYVTDQEIVTLVLSAILTLAAGLYVH